ncbi:ATP-binding cassette domain-containing protein [Shewanella sp. JBTF-M18]|uniref:ATP-binding cassette domain-containing protein n=1 Tax=Shewanella insulae TaxID=2681496 RepID=A0A6L7I067_9GAMM|nr:ATP-binding cassette domain-containing protein [Shewanella insulae]MXR69670.1 ATP-binding cassette domain-containing protein [Shewanella insulae]
MNQPLDPIHLPKSLLIALFHQLGLSVQASNIGKSDLHDRLTHLEAYILLKKHHVGIKVQALDANLLVHSVYPFILLPQDGEPMVARRSNHSFQYLSQDNQWLALDKLPSVGHVFLVESLPAQSRNSSVFASHLAKLRPWYHPIFWLSLLSSLGGLAIPLFTMAVYDRVIGGQAPQILPSIALGAALALGIFVASRLLRAQALANVSNRFARDLSGITFNRLLSMPLGLLSRVGLSSHLARMRNAEKVRSLVAGPGGAGLIDLPFTLIALVAITLLSGFLVLVPLAMLLIFYLVMKALDRFTQAAAPTISGEYQNSLNELSTHLLPLKSAGESGAWYEQFMRRARENCRQNFLYSKRTGLNAAVAHAMGLFTALATVFTGIFLVLNQSITPGALIACVMLIWRITGPAQLAFASRQKFTLLKGAIDQFDRFMAVTTEFNELRLDSPDLNKAPTLSFKHVTLRYSGDSEPALSGVTLDIEAGETVAIIGPNGSGKTSLLLTTIGVIEPQAGFVTVNGKNLKQFDPEIFRQWAAYSPTNSELLPGTLADNLRLAKPEASDEELKQAITDAGGASLLQALKQNIDANLFSRGTSMFSAVESSYISLARALLKGSPLLVMDEPIANRNPFARQAFIKTLRNLKGKTTILFTTHDHSLIQQADKVVILDKGTVVYAGPLPNQDSVVTQSETNQDSTPTMEASQNE